MTRCPGSNGLAGSRKGQSLPSSTCCSVQTLSGFVMSAVTGEGSLLQGMADANSNLIWKVMGTSRSVYSQHPKANKTDRENVAGAENCATSLSYVVVSVLSYVSGTLEPCFVFWQQGLAMQSRPALSSLCSPGRSLSGSSSHASTSRALGLQKRAATPSS